MNFIFSFLTKSHDPPRTKAVTPKPQALKQAVSGVFLPLAAADLALARPMRPPAPPKACLFFPESSQGLGLKGLGFRVTSQ